MRARHVSFVILALCLCGCPSKPANEAVDSDHANNKSKIKVEGPLRILVLDDSKLATILEREWRALSEHPVEVTNREVASLLTQLDDGLKKLDTDVVIFPSAMLGQLVEQKLLRPIPRELIRGTEYRNGEIFDLVRRRETQWGKQPYAVSFGSPTLVLLRRTDLVPNAPNTWSELNREVRRLSGETLPAGAVPLVQPLGNRWAARMLLVRAATYLYDSSRVSGVFEYSTMHPQIASQPFVRALEEMVEDLSSESRLDLTPASALEEFLNGRAAMAVTWPSAFSSGELEEPVSMPVAISELPGAIAGNHVASRTGAVAGEEDVQRVTLFGVAGRLGAVSRSAKNATLANVFLAWATGPEQSGNVCPRSDYTAPFRESHRAYSSMWMDPRLPADLAENYVLINHDALCRAEAFQSPRLPGQHQYMSALDDRVLAVLRGQQTAGGALNGVAESWNATTIRLGEHRQIAAYRRSLGVDTD